MPITQSRTTAARTPRGEPLLIEVAWEVCNKVGGIYTVLRSKAPAMAARWDRRYCLVGPYHEATAEVEFEPAPLTGAIGQTVKQLRDMGVGAHYGWWLISGRPRIVLVDYLSVFPYLHEVKYRLWEDHGIATPADDDLINNTVAFGEAVRRFLQVLAEREGEKRKIVAHFHEWMAGVSIPMLRAEKWPGSIVFTTHATLLGRFLAMNDPSFYSRIGAYNPDEEARKFNVEAQYRLERAAAHGANVFTTVSDVTADECVSLLGRKPDCLTPNGLNNQRFEALHELQSYHRQYKERINRFITGHFFPSYRFDLEKVLYFFTSGRYEYRNKGMDMTIESLARLNARLKANNPRGVTVVAFIITQRPIRSINVGALQSHAMLTEFRTVVDNIKEQIGEGLFKEATQGRVPALEDLVDQYWLLRLKRTIHAWRRGLPPAIVTHDLVDDGRDEVLNQLRDVRLFNESHDPVKVIYHPAFIEPSNPLFGMEYEQFVRGCHLGVFPSYYEPWGYTPLESIALGVPAIASDLSGFGSYIQKLEAFEGIEGLSVLQRRYQGWAAAAEQLTDMMENFCHRDRRERVAMRNEVENLSVLFDWSTLADHYMHAYELAMAQK